jgi:hypothetical protein
LFEKKGITQSERSTGKEKKRKEKKRKKRRHDDDELERKPLLLRWMDASNLTR